LVFTLEDVSIIDFKVDHEEVFKNMKLDLSTESLGLENGLEQAFKSTMPVYFKNYSYGGVTSIDFRGTGAERTKVYWNGIPVNSPTLGSFDFSLIPSFLISEAKVRFGGASLVDGGGGIGGSVQLNQSKNISKNKVSIIGSFGSFGSYSGAVLSQFKKNKLSSDTRVYYHQAKNDFSFVNTYKKDSPTEKRTNNQLWRYAMQQSFTYDISNNNSLDFNFLYSYVDRHIPSTISSENDGTIQQDQLLFAQLGYNHTFASAMFLKIRSSYQNQLNIYYDDNIDANNTVNAWNNKVDWGIRPIQSLSVNASVRYDLYFVDTFGTGEVSEQQHSTFVSADWNITKALLVSGGARIEGIDSQFSPAMPFLGADYRFPKSWGNAKASVTKVYRYPTINERYWQPGGNLDLNAENGWNYELSYLNTIRLKKVELKLELTGFYGIINDWILWYPTAEFGSIWQAQNLWKVNNSGFEGILAMSRDLSENSSLTLKLMYTFNASHVIESEQNFNDIENKQLILVPRNMVFIPCIYTVKNLSVEVDYTYTGLRYTDRKNENALDAYSLLDLALNYHFTKSKLDLSFRLNNILDKSYQTYPGQPMPGINFNLQLLWQLI
jgi:iron complex outermembrane receptor protein